MAEKANENPVVKQTFLVLGHCWFGGGKGIQSVKNTIPVIVRYFLKGPTANNWNVIVNYLRQRKAVRLYFSLCLSVCLFVHWITQKSKNGFWL